jgi:hypothetical protein
MAHAWDRIQQLVRQHPGPFTVIALDGADSRRDPASFVAEIDQRDNRLVVLDPRRWTLYNGDHARTKQHIELLLGTGEVTVPHAASCVFAAGDKAHKDLIRKAALDVLAWEHVERQLSTDDDEAQQKVKTNLRDARHQLDNRIHRAFKDFAYLTAGGTGEAAAVHFDKFESDNQTSLRGDHIWTHLVAQGRAVEPNNLRTLDLLLEQFPRPLSPSEIINAFYSDPRFPLAPTTDTIIAAWDDLLDGVLGGEGGWSLIDKDELPLNFTGRGQVAINRKDVTFQPTPSYDENSGTQGDQPGGGGEGAEDIWTSGDDTGTLGGEGDGTYNATRPHREYRIRVPHASMTVHENRTAMWSLLMRLARIVDPAQGEEEPEIVDVSITLTARETDIHALKSNAEALGGKFDDEEPLA